jgi:endonuclease/exonuclease/phosphatase family metal-dependent hydrolase
MSLRVLTLNLRQDLDRWTERLPLVVEALAGAAADVVALQEVALPISQDRLVASMLNDAGLPYAVHTAPKWGDQNAEAVSLLTLAPARDHAVIALPGAGGRVAQRVVVATAGGDVAVVNTHLHHEPYDDESVRLPQAKAILAWLEDDGLLDRCVVVGDLNASPGSPTVRTLQGRLTSLLPDGTPTFPTPLAAGDFSPVQIDHVLVASGLAGLAGSARLVADRGHPDDASLWPSDHLGVCADIQ